MDRDGAPEMGRIAGRLELDDVVFAYGDEPVIHGISIDVPEGGCIALVGESGGGKSTTAKLIARFYDPSRARCASTAPTCATCSCGRSAASSASCSRIRSSSAARSPTTSASRGRRRPTRRSPRPPTPIGVDRITARFDGGLDHVVREGGSGLSAGERQLISIARALLADPRILILDEATSNIDRPSEILIEQAFDTLLARPHVDHHRAPARDGAARGRDPRRREGAGHAARHRGGAAGRGRAVPPTGPDAPGGVAARRGVEPR